MSQFKLNNSLKKVHFNKKNEKPTERNSIPCSSKLILSIEVKNFRNNERRILKDKMFFSLKKM